MNIEITRQIDGPPERVFQALTDADDLSRWFPSSAESDPRTGGDYVLRFRFDDDSKNHTYAGQYEDVTPNVRVRLSVERPVRGNDRSVHAASERRRHGAATRALRVEQRGGGGSADARAGLVLLRRQPRALSDRPGGPAGRRDAAGDGWRRSRDNRRSLSTRPSV